MGPPTKKRKESPSCTLLDFFSSADGTVKRTRGSQIQRRREVASRELIVIDSDSDDAVETRSRSAEPRTGVSEDSHFLPPFTSAPIHSDNKDAFGLPSALLRSPNLRTETSGSQHPHPPVSPTQGHSTSLVGTSAPLLEDATYKYEPGTKVTNPVVGQSATGISAVDPTIDFSIGEWATGDDEFIALKVLDDGGGVEQGEEESGAECVCPVCGIGLTGMPAHEAHIHVNQCLDIATLENDHIQKPMSMLTKPDSTSDSGANTFAKCQGGHLFSVLMNSHKENETWIEADAAANCDSRRNLGNRRKAPFYKVLQGMPVAVDAFCYGTIPGVTAYFLTHAHSDHYTSLGSKWKSGPIYCSEETANLIIHMLAVDPRWIHPLPLDVPTIIPNTGGVSVTLIEANHCPGSCLFFFEGQQTIDAGDSVFKSPFIGSSRIFRYLHCGDFRASPRHVIHPAVNGKHIDHIYLDTTYLDPKYTFAPQPIVVSACAELARRLIGGVGGIPNARMNHNSTMDAWMKSSTSAEMGDRGLQDRMLVIVGTYSIGKERIVKAIAQAIGAKIYCDPRKTAILRCQADKELHALLTSNPAEANVHILPLGAVTSDNLRSYLQKFKSTFSRVIGFRPTGWTYSPPLGSGLNGSIRSIISHGQSRSFSYTDLRPSQKSSYNVQIFGVPYSEHSSFFELTCFAMSCDWGRMIPTVNVGNPTSRLKMTKWLRRWEAEKKDTRSYTIQPRAVDYW